MSSLWLFRLCQQSERVLSHVALQLPFLCGLHAALRLPETPGYDVLYTWSPCLGASAFSSPVSSPYRRAGPSPSGPGTSRRSSKSYRLGYFPQSSFHLSLRGSRRGQKKGESHLSKTHGFS